MSSKPQSYDVGMCDCGRVGTWMTGKGFRCERCRGIENRLRTGDVVAKRNQQKDRQYYYEAGIGSRELHELIHALDRWLIAHGEDPHKYEFNRYADA